MAGKWRIMPALMCLAGLVAGCGTSVQESRPEVPGASPDLVSQSIQRYLRDSSAPDSTGTGRFPAMKEEVAGLPDHVIYRPANLDRLEAVKLPVYVFGNGACSRDGASQRQHLLEIASHGYLAIAAGRIYSGPGIEVSADDWAKHRDKTSYTLLGDAIDWAIAENTRPGSPYFGRIDTRHIAVSGYSCGGAQALRYAADPRVSTFVIMNAGLSEPETPRTGEMAVDAAVLDQVAVPVLYMLGGPTDVAHNNGMADFRRLTGVPTVALNLDVTHQGTFSAPNGGAAAQAVVAWLEWNFRSDGAAARSFVGEDCGFCRDPQWTVEKRNLDRIPGFDRP